MRCRPFCVVSLCCRRVESDGFFDSTDCRTEAGPCAGEYPCERPALNQSSRLYSLLTVDSLNFTSLSKVFPDYRYVRHRMADCAGHPDEVMLCAHGS